MTDVSLAYAHLSLQEAERYLQSVRSDYEAGKVGLITLRESEREVQRAQADIRSAQKAIDTRNNLALAVVILDRYSRMLDKLVMDTPKDQTITNDMVKLGQKAALHIAAQAGGIPASDYEAASKIMRAMADEITGEQ